MAPHLARIDLYPVKSLDGLTVTQATVLPSGALGGDRAFALVDGAGRFVNGKREARIHQVRSRYGDDLRHVSLWTTAEPVPHPFELPWGAPAPTSTDTPLAAWLSRVLGRSVRVIHNGDLGFPDDIASPGPTVISTATLETVATWFEMDLAEARRRFRTNLEIGGVPAFWEDQCFREDGKPVAFTIGDVTVHGINPCQRCVVPTRDSRSGEATAQFQARFIEQRSRTLAPGVARSPFNHFYRLAVNTRIPTPEPGQVLQVGDPIALINP